MKNSNSKYKTQRAVRMQGSKQFYKGAIGRLDGCGYCVEESIQDSEPIKTDHKVSPLMAALIALGIGTSAAVYSPNSIAQININVNCGPGNNVCQENELNGEFNIVEGGVNGNSTNIATNSTNIATNSASIVANSAAISANGAVNDAQNTTISSIVTGVIAQGSLVDTNSTNIDTNSTNIDTNSTNIGDEYRYELDEYRYELDEH